MYEVKFIVVIVVCIILKIPELKFSLNKQQMRFLWHIYLCNINAQSQSAAHSAILVISTYVRLVLNFASAMCDVRDCLLA